MGEPPESHNCLGAYCMNNYQFQPFLTSSDVQELTLSSTNSETEYQHNLIGESLHTEPQGMPIGEGLLPSSLDLSQTETIVESAAARLKSNLIELTTEPTLEATLTTAFGAQVDTQLAKELLKDVAEGKNGPEVRVIDGDLLKGQGAFGGDTIFISDDLIVGSADQPEILDRVLLEETGHYLDQALNDADSPGDEGAIFANLVKGNPLSINEIAAISIEDDSSTIIIDNQLLSVENNIGSYPGYIFKYEEGQSLSYDSNVEDWQQAMNDLGWNIGVDGLYGSESRGAALEFQQEHTDLVNDGIVGENTWNKTIDLLDGGTGTGTNTAQPSGTQDSQKDKETLLAEKADLESQIESLGTTSPSVTSALQDQLEGVEAQLNELDGDSPSDTAEETTSPEPSSSLQNTIQNEQEIQFNLDNVGLWGKNQPSWLNKDLSADWRFTIGDEWSPGPLKAAVDLSGGIGAFASPGTVDLDLSGSFDFSFDPNSSQFTVETDIGTGRNSLSSAFGVGLGADFSISASAGIDLPLLPDPEFSFDAGFELDGADVLLGAIAPGLSKFVDIDTNLRFADQLVQNNELKGSDTLGVEIDLTEAILKGKKLGSLDAEDLLNIKLEALIAQESTLNIVGFQFDQDNDGEADFSTDINSSKTVELSTDLSNLRVQPIVNLNTTLSPQISLTGAASMKNLLNSIIPDSLENWKQELFDESNPLGFNVSVTQTFGNLKIEEFNPFISANKWENIEIT